MIGLKTVFHSMGITSLLPPIWLLYRQKQYLSAKKKAGLSLPSLQEECFATPPMTNCKHMPPTNESYLPSTILAGLA